MAQENTDDCYFYYYSSCTKGKECPFRHCEAALGTETVCVLWREGKCFRANCKFRHMENRIKRGLIPCFWENQPGGCRKPHCVFLHQKSKYKIVNVPAGKKRLILPESASPKILVASKVPDMNDSFAPSYSPNPESKEISLNCSENGADDIPSQPVAPFVVSFDEGEESDSESVCSTPMKSGSSDPKCIDSSSARRNLSANFTDKPEKDFGVKTLEQIRMEKIHKESEHFYKSDDTSGKSYGNKTLEINQTPTLHSGSINSYSAYDAPSLIAKASQNGTSYKAECYPPESDYISISTNKPVEKSKLAPKNETTANSIEQESDLRGRLLKKREFPSYSEKESPLSKRTISFKKQEKKVEGPLDFKIKTLDEIRKERENKQGDKVKSFYEDPVIHKKVKLVHRDPVESSSGAHKSANLSELQKVSGKLKIKRLSTETYSKLTAGSNDALDESSVKIKDTRPQMILHEVQNIEDDQNKKNHVPVLQKAISALNGKRKSDSSMVGKSKSLKLDSSDVKMSTLLNAPNEFQNGDDLRVMQPHVDTVSKDVVVSPVSSNTSVTHPSPVTRDSKNNFELNTQSSNNVFNDISVSENTTDIETSAVTDKKDTDKKISRLISVDEFDSFLSDTDVNLDEEEVSSDKGAEDIFKEFEQLLES